jgi:hypothetical protein
MDSSGNLSWRDKIVNSYVSFTDEQYIFYKTICEENRTKFVNSNLHYF